jgi:transcriptional regulator with XRE-family HTH domain
MAIQTKPSTKEPRRYSAGEVRVRLQLDLDKSGLTQAEYAVKLGISQPMLSQILLGNREPNEKALKLIHMKVVERYYVEDER